MFCLSTYTMSSSSLDETADQLPGCDEHNGLYTWSMTSLLPPTDHAGKNKREFHDKMVDYQCIYTETHFLR